jgi:myo-inositol-1(or 4)-monophosphatase
MLEGSHAIQRAGAGGVGEKKNMVDLVTEYDVKVEDLVRVERLRAHIRTFNCNVFSSLEEPKS